MALKIGNARLQDLLRLSAELEDSPENALERVFTRIGFKQDADGRETHARLWENGACVRYLGEMEEETPEGFAETRKDLYSKADGLVSDKHWKFFVDSIGLAIRVYDFRSAVNEAPVVECFAQGKGAADVAEIKSWVRTSEQEYEERNDWASLNNDYVASAFLKNPFGARRSVSVTNVFPNARIKSMSPDLVPSFSIGF